MSGLMEARLPEMLIRSSNRQKVLDFCTLAVYDNCKSGQLNIVCHFRMKPVMVANVYDQ
jgi:hypothetical protein